MTARRAPALRAGAIVVVVLGVLVTLSSRSLANGRFPSANQLVVDPIDGAHIVVRTTFGLLQSADAGATWSWVCERALSPDGFQDPEVMITTGGRVSVGLADGLVVGDRGGCQWTRAAALAGDDVIDLVADNRDPATAYAAILVRVDGAFNAAIAGTRDGVAWAAPGPLLSNTYPLTIEIASSRPQRLYLGANDGNLETGFIGVSDDGGATWTMRDSPGGVDAVYVSAVDPYNADRVYVRSYSPQSKLYASEDGARTWTTVVESPVPLLGFALSPDGRQLAVGGRQGLTILARGDGTAADAGAGSLYTVTATNPLPVGCLTWTTRGLFACADEASASFTIGVSVDAGLTFTSLLRLADLTPASCAAGTSAVSCASEWCATAAVIGASCAPAVDAAADMAGGEGSDAGARGLVSPAGCACDAGGDASVATPLCETVAALIMILAAEWLAIRFRWGRRRR